MRELFQCLPSVDACLGLLGALAEKTPRALLKEQVNAFLEARRDDIRAGRITEQAQLSLDALREDLECFVEQGARPHFQYVLNATGVVLHTNMGRAVLAEEAVDAVCAACRGYSNLELELATGKRGSRYSHVEKLLCTLTGAEAALVVNNNAAAVFLTLDTLCREREVIVARGQLVEIGGSFRIPDVMSRSGATLREVGCTNRVHRKDYEQALSPETAALMRVHTSNYRVVGFHADVPAEELAALAHANNLLFIEDLGSGSFIDLAEAGLPGEPTVQAIVASGADVVTFSGDKVLGGPQAGLIVGKKAAIDRIKANPMNRALRIDKMTLAALEATLRLYMDERTVRERIPTLRMILASSETLRLRAGKLAARLRKSLGGAAQVRVLEGAARVGGGSFPEDDLPGYVVHVRPTHCTAEALRQRLLTSVPPLIARIEADDVCLDPRTLTDTECSTVAKVLVWALNEHN